MNTVTIRRLVISPRPITEILKKEQLDAAELMKIPDRLDVVTEFRHVPGIVSKLRLESDRDIDEASLREVVQEFGYFNIHLVLSENDWEKLGIRDTLWGQSAEIGGQAITYERRASGSYKLAPKYKETFVDSNGVERKLSDFSESALRAWHELDHAVRRILGISAPITHYHFYGYATKYKTLTRTGEKTNKPRRYVRNPDPLAGWRILPFENLPLNKWQKRNLLERLLKNTLVEIVHRLIKRQTQKDSIILKGLQPIVRRKAEQLIATMAQKGYMVDITSGYRGETEQNTLYAKGRTTPGNIVTNAKYGDSMHNYGVAFDVAFIKNGKPSWSNQHPWNLLGEVGESLGLEWGGRWKSLNDRPHFQYKAGYSLADFKNNRVNYKKFL